MGDQRASWDGRRSFHLDEIDLPFHLLADIFPLLEGNQFKELVEDIRANGLREPIVLYAGAIVDGRNRYRACLKAGVKPEFKDFDGTDALSYVISLNLTRRHLNGSERAAVAAKIANMRQGERNDLQP
jgi:ParB-like chromosome segregation protein Spo0J